MLTHSRWFVVLFLLVLVPSLGCRSTRHKKPVYERERVENASSGCSHCG